MEKKSKKEEIYGPQIKQFRFFEKRLNELGISKKYTGFYYLVDIMDKLINFDEPVRSYSREVYPMIAKKYNKSEITVERNIRHVIEKSWSLEMRDKLLFSWRSEEMPTCCQFINMLRNYLMLELGAKI